MNKIPISKDGLPYIFFSILLAFMSYFISWIVCIFFLCVALFVAFFFRNPNRKIVKNESHILSPADGVVMNIEEVFEDTFLNCDSVKVSIFLSIFNVHVNKSPIDGKVGYSNYRPGKFIPAFKPHCSDINEKNTIGIENSKIKILVSQVTGFIARRIVCWVKNDDIVEQGKNFGLIKFGSCTEIVIPKENKIMVKIGDKVRGGITLIGVINDEN